MSTYTQLTQEERYQIYALMKAGTQAESTKYTEENAKRLERRHYYQSWNRDRLLAMTTEEFEEYMQQTLGHADLGQQEIRHR